MDKEEYDLWHKLDIGGFGGKVTSIKIWTAAIGANLENNNYTKAADCLTQLETLCRGISSRIEQIEPDKYDQRFPTDVITSLYKVVLPILNKIPEDIKDVMNKKTDFDSVKNSIYEDADHMFLIASKLGTNPKYKEYRVVTNEEDRID